MGVFDQAARRVAKRDGPGFFRWALPGLAPALQFAGWRDTRTEPDRGEAELTCDTLAEFQDAARPEAPWLFVVEFQTEPRGDDLERLLEYMLRFRRMQKPEADARLRYSVGGVTLNLTGPHQLELLHMAVPGVPGLEVRARVARRALREDDAAGTLAQVASGRSARCVLPWVPLMRGGGDSATLTEWQRLAGAEPREETRLGYATDALILADLAGVLEAWEQALEGWNVRTSRIVAKWQEEGRAEGLAEGRAETRREDLLLALQARCQGPVPEDLAAAIRGLTDLAELERWFRAALTAASYEEFRAAVRA